MKDILENIKQNKFLKIVGNILYTCIFIIVILMLIVVALQRFSNNTVAFGGFRIFTVATGSMEPEYLVSDILVSKQTDLKDIEVGDDVVYIGKEGTFKDKVVTHRVLEKREENGGYKFITKGIANEEADPEIDGSQIYGKVIYKIKTLSFISGKIITNIYLFYFIIFIPIVLILYKQIRNIKNSLIHEDDDEDDDDEDDDE